MKYQDSSKVSKILTAFQNGEKLSSIDAFHRFNTTRLAAYVYTLRKDGHRIISFMRNFISEDGSTQRYAVYWIPPSYRTNQ